MPGIQGKVQPHSVGCDLKELQETVRHNETACTMLFDWVWEVECSCTFQLSQAQTQLWFKQPRTCSDIILIYALKGTVWYSMYADKPIWYDFNVNSVFSLQDKNALTGWLPCKVPRHQNTQNCMIAKSKRVRDCFLIWSQEVAAAPYHALPTISRSGNRISSISSWLGVNHQKVQASTDLACFIRFQQYCNRTGTPLVSGIIMYHPVFREHDSCSLQLKVIATARNRHTAKTWAAHNVMQFLGLHFIHRELKTTPLYHGAHGKWMPCCPSWWEACEFVAHPASSSLVNKAFRNPNKTLKEVWCPSPNYLLVWHHVTLLMQHTVHISCFSQKYLKAAAVLKGLWCKLASAGLPVMMAKLATYFWIPKRSPLNAGTRQLY